ncbi:MAG: hypothetical protein LBF27_25855 [Sphingobacterium sp.]|jgi:hypothetical protein|nr:hypothetical protein [Sphingobacterium sp.]
MAVEKGLVLSAIETKLKGKSLSKNFKENLASKWAEKIEKDEDIDSYVDDREDILIEANSEADRRAVAAAKKAKEDKDKEKTDEKEDDVEVDPDTPKWAKDLFKQNQVLTSKIESFEANQKSQSIDEKFRKDERITSLKGLQEHMFKGRIPKNEEDYETSVEDFVNDWKPFLEKNKLSEEGNDTPPSGAGGKKGDVKKISSDEAKAVVAAMGSN